MGSCKVFLVASPQKSRLEVLRDRLFAVAPDMFNRDSNHLALEFWFPDGRYLRCEPGVHNRSLRGHLSAGKASTEEELTYKGERKALVAEVKTTREAVFDRFAKYHEVACSSQSNVERRVDTYCASGKMPPTAQRDWIQGFIGTFEGLNAANIEAPLQKLEKQLA